MNEPRTIDEVSVRVVKTAPDSHEVLFEREGTHFWLNESDAKHIVKVFEQIDAAAGWRTK